MRWGYLILCGLGLFGLGLEACAQQPGGFVSEYYPLEVGSSWVYALGNKEVTVTVEKKDILEIIRRDAEGKDKKPEKVLAARLVVTSGEKRLTEHVAVLEDGVYKLTAAGKTIAPPLRFLKLEKGEPRWDCDSISENVVLKGTFMSVSDSVTVPISPTPIQAVKVDCPEFQIGTQKMSVQYWFAPKLGIVKQRVKMDNHDLTMELKEFKPGK